MPIKYNDGTKVWTPKYALYNGTSLSQIYYDSQRNLQIDPVFMGKNSTI